MFLGPLRTDLLLDVFVDLRFSTVPGATSSGLEGEWGPV